MPQGCIAISYRRYRLLNTSQLSEAKVSAIIGQYQRLTSHAMETHTFSGELLIDVFLFLSASKTTCDDSDIPEGATVRLMSKYFSLGRLNDNSTHIMRWEPPASAPRTRRLCSTCSSRF